MKPITLPSVFMSLLLFASCVTQPQWHRYELCFGLSQDNGKVIISGEAWQQFQNEEIAPRFPNGYTITQANGYWSNDGHTYSEPSEILLVVAPDSDNAQPKLEAIAQAYARQFHQDAVLQITSPAEVEFHSVK